MNFNENLIQQVTQERDRLQDVLNILQPKGRRGRPAGSTKVYSNGSGDEVEVKHAKVGRPKVAKGRTTAGQKSQSLKMKAKWAKWRKEAKRTGKTVQEVRAASKGE